MAFFPLNYRCSVRRKVTSQDRAGQQKVDEWVEIETPMCLYLETSGNRQASSREEYQGVFAFYLEATSGITEGDRVYNITDKLGRVLEAGPLEAESVKNVPGIFGKPHHISCKLKGVS